MTEPAHTLEITYCNQCNWMLRAAWMLQELLSTFDGDLKHATLTPGTGGIYTITLDGELLWDRKLHGGFPDAKEIKQRVRDQIAPGRDLGHLDRG